ncbi:hemerythrin domain-containing protein [Flaviaesturariibacter terrae]
MKRTNFFQLIHQALRRLLFDTATLLQHCDFTDEEAAGRALDAIRETILLFETHAAHEDAHFLPAVATYEPSVADCFAKEHVEDLRIGQELVAAAETFFLAADAESRQQKGCELQVAYNAFIAFNLQHMAKEERLLNELLLRYYTVAEVQALQQRVVQSTPPWIYDRVAHWMLLGNNETDTAQWLRAMASTAPEIVYATLLQKAATILPNSRWASLREKLDVPMLA